MFFPSERFPFSNDLSLFNFFYMVCHLNNFKIFAKIRVEFQKDLCDLIV